MTKYTKRPVTIEARQFTDSASLYDIIKWVKAEGGMIGQFPARDNYFISTLEGDMEITPGDWIIQGVAGEFYPCKPEIFEQTHRLAEHVISMEDRAALDRFTSPNFALPDGRREAVEELRRTFYDAAYALILAAPHSKSRAVALTELETAMMWGVKAFYGAPGEHSYQPVPS